WNAMMAAAFLHAGAVLDRPDCNALALKVLSRIWAEAWDDARGMAHVIGRPEPHGLLDDNIQTAAAFLDAYEATGEEAWLARAVDWALNPVTRIEVAGPRGEGPACAMHLLALQAYRPRKVVIRKTAQRPAATLCVGTTCSLPVATTADLKPLLT